MKRTRTVTLAKVNAALAERFGEGQYVASIGRDRRERHRVVISGKQMVDGPHTTPYRSAAGLLPGAWVAYVGRYCLNEGSRPNA